MVLVATGGAGRSYVDRRPLQPVQDRPTHTPVDRSDVDTAARAISVPNSQADLSTCQLGVPLSQPKAV